VSARGSISLMLASMPEGAPHNIGGYTYLRPLTSRIYAF
jgi:hypothetical protein